jgi:hypothetical protein
MQHFQLGDAATDAEAWLNSLGTKIGGCDDPAAAYQCDTSNPFYSVQCPNGVALACGPGGSSFSACSTQAASDPNYAQLTAMHDDVQANWSPTGYYNPEDIKNVVIQQQQLAASALALLQGAMTSCQAAPGCGSGDLLSQMQYNLTVQPSDGTNIMTQAQQFVAQANAAESGLSAVVQSSYVQAPGFKSWVLASLDTISTAVQAALVVQCQMPSWAAAISTVVNAAQGFVSFVKAIVGIAADVVQAAVTAGTAVVNTISTGLTVTGWILQNLPMLAGFVILGVGGFFAYKHRDRIKAYFGRRGSTAAVAGARHLGNYEVRHDGEVYFFPTKARAKAQAKLLEREYGGRARVTGL